MILSPIIDKKANTPIYMQLYGYIKKEIIDGSLHANEKIPSIREASSTLNLSKTTIENAYNQLVIEGYVENIPKKGYFVSKLSDYKVSSNKKITDDNFSQKLTFQNIYVNNGVDYHSFDTVIWKRIYNKVINDENSLIHNSGDFQGELLLRKEISGFINRTRGAKTISEQIIVGAGVQYLIGILISLIKKDYSIAAVEDPGFKKAEYIFEDYNFKLAHIPVYNSGLSIDTLRSSSSKLVYVSPSHQYPLGSVMPINKRLELLDWAFKNNGLIIEDDYDSIIRYENMPVPCLQGLDKNDCVIYLGSFSKILLPSIRISYMVLPRKLLTKYSSLKNRYTQSASKIDQLVLSNFIKDGYLDRHLRKIRRIYKKKNQLITKIIEEKANNLFKIVNADSGLHLVLETISNKSINEINDCAVNNNISLNIISKKGNNLLLSLNYSGISDEKIPEFIESLIKIF